MESLKSNGKYSPAKTIAAVAGLLTVLSGSALAWYKTIAGEPEAREAKDRVNITWKRVMREVTEMKQTYQKLHTRVVYFQGREEGHQSGVLQAKLDQVQAKYDDLLAKTSTKKPQQGSLTAEALRGELVEVRKLRSKLEKGIRAAKSAPQIEQRPAPQPAPAPPWGK